MQANGYETHRIIGLPGPSQSCGNDVFAARRDDLQIPSAGAAETHGWIERPLGRILDSHNSFGKFEAPGVSGGGPTCDGKRDNFPSLSIDV